MHYFSTSLLITHLQTSQTEFKYAMFRIWMTDMKYPRSYESFCVHPFHALQKHQEKSCFLATLSGNEIGHKKTEKHSVPAEKHNVLIQYLLQLFIEFSLPCLKHIQ